MHWLILLLLTALFFGFYNFFIKLSAGHIHEILGAVILQVIAALLGGAALLYLKIPAWTFRPKESALPFLPDYSLG
jgi:bacterial/archaeal transporter family protein